MDYIQGPVIEAMQEYPEDMGEIWQDGRNTMQSVFFMRITQITQIKNK